MSIEDRWKGARTGPRLRWQVRWREGGAQRKRSFALRASAEAFDARRRADPESAVVRPQVTVKQVVNAWLATTTGLRPSTQDAYAYDAAEVIAGFGERLASGVKPSEVRTWAARDRGSSQRRRSLMAMRRAYRQAIADRILTVDPTDRIPLPKATPRTMRFLSWAELEHLAATTGTDSPLVWLLGTCGLRLGEALGLDGGDVDRKRKRIKVRRSYSSSSQGTELGPTKGAKAREVPVSQFVLDMLPVTSGPLFVGGSGGRLNPHNWRERVFKPAARTAGLGDMHPHELRHTAASLAIAAGADVKAVQRMLGHASAAMTLDLYAHLWDTQLDAVADRMDEARERETTKRARHLRVI